MVECEIFEFGGDFVAVVVEMEGENFQIVLVCVRGYFL